MRRLLRRKAIIIVAAAIVSFTAIPAAGIVATATPALASTASLCNVSGHNYCADTTTLNTGEPVFLTILASSRLFNKVDQHFTCCGGFEVFRLHFAGDTTKCLGVAGSSLNITVRLCSGGNDSNVNWAQEPQSGGGIKWYSNTKNKFLSSDNALGHQLFVTSGCSGCYLKWTPLP